MNLWSLFWTKVIPYQSETSNPRKPKSRQYIFWGGCKAQTIIFTQNKAFRVPLCQQSFQTTTIANIFLSVFKEKQQCIHYTSSTGITRFPLAFKDFVHCFKANPAP
jgi:hypothetical protein